MTFPLYFLPALSPRWHVPSPAQCATCSLHLPTRCLWHIPGPPALTSRAGSAFLAGTSHTGWDRKGFSLSSPAAVGVPTPGASSWLGPEAGSGLGGGGCGSVPVCPGAVWRLRHRPYGFLRWMNHRWPWPGSVAPAAPARAAAEAGEGVMKSGFRHGPCHQLLLEHRVRRPWPLRRARCRLGRWQAWHNRWWQLPRVSLWAPTSTGAPSSSAGLAGPQFSQFPRVPSWDGSTRTPPCGLWFEGASGEQRSPGSLLGRRPRV